MPNRLARASFFREKGAAGGETPLACNPPGAPSSFRASTTKQRLWRRLARGRNNKEFDDPGVRELFKNSDSRVFEAALQPADVGAVDTGVDREAFSWA
jgi:hypothetical protein